MTKQIYLFFLLLLPSFSWGQNGFEKVYLFEDSLARIGNLYETDSCFYYVASVGRNTGRLYHRFGKLDLSGNEIIGYNYEIDTFFQYSGFALSEIQLNANGNFVFAYTNQHLNGINYLAFRLLEQSPNGTIVFDSLYTDLWVSDSLILFDDSKLSICNDNTYLYATTYWDYNTDSNGPVFDGKAGTLVVKLNQAGQILWKKKFHHTSTAFSPPAFYFRDLELHSDNSFTLYINHNRITAQFDADDIAINYFINCDANGNEIDRDVFQDTPYCYGTPGYQELPDGTSIFGYLDSYTFGNPPNNDETNVRPVIAKLNQNHQLIWKTPMANKYYSSVGESISFNDFLILDDGIISATMYSKLIETPKQIAFLEIYKLSLNGVKTWKREYAYFVGDSINDGEYVITDIDSIENENIIFSGYVNKWDDYQGNKPYQYGYLLKTNCLGFLGAPQAAVGILSSTTDSVVFINQSVQAGSYTWQFGDGQSTTTTEEVDTMVHHYAQAGTYTITLIAHGCNNENDTITFQHTIADPTPIYHGDGTLLTVFPNPLVAGNPLSAYIGAIDSPHDLVLVDELGKVLFKQSVVSGNTNYLLPTNQLAAAQYRLQLMQSNKMIESEAVIVVE